MVGVDHSCEVKEHGCSFNSGGVFLFTTCFTRIALACAWHSSFQVKQGAVDGGVHNMIILGGTGCQLSQYSNWWLLCRANDS